MEGAEGVAVVMVEGAAVVMVEGQEEARQPIIHLMRQSHTTLLQGKSHDYHVALLISAHSQSWA